MGFSSGAIAQTVAVPMDVCKIRMQADGLAVAAGKKARYTGLIDALTKITKAEGVRYFFIFYINVSEYLTLKYFVCTGPWALERFVASCVSCRDGEPG